MTQRHRSNGRDVGLGNGLSAAECRSRPGRPEHRELAAQPSVPRRGIAGRPCEDALAVRSLCSKRRARAGADWYFRFLGPGLGERFGVPLKGIPLSTTSTRSSRSWGVETSTASPAIQSWGRIHPPPGYRSQ